MFAACDGHWYDGHQALTRLISAGRVELVSRRRWFFFVTVIVADDAELVVLLALLDVVAARCRRDSDPIILVLTRYQVIGRHRMDDHMIPLP